MSHLRRMNFVGATVATSERLRAGTATGDAAPRPDLVHGLRERTA